MSAAGAGAGAWYGDGAGASFLLWNVARVGILAGPVPEPDVVIGGGAGFAAYRIIRRLEEQAVFTEIDEYIATDSIRDLYAQLF